MKIAFIIEYFPPYAEGGSEWSTYYLAKDLVKKGHQVSVITPDYGHLSKETKEGIRIIRYPFYLKLRIKDQLPGNFALTNPLWIIWTSIFLVFYLLKEGIEVIHIQGKYSVIPTFMANLILNKPVLITLRDYIPICSYGLCIRKKEKACNIVEYLTKEFFEYYKQYVSKKSLVSLFINFIFAVYGRFSKVILAFFIKRMHIVVLSNKQRKIYQSNGFKNIEVIANSYEFGKVKRKRRSSTVLYVGRLTSGKGVDILIKVCKSLLSRNKDVKFIFVGKGRLENEIKKIRNRRILLMGQLNHDKVMELMSRVSIVVVPSIWPEPFGRVALEALANGTPVVVSNKGGLPDIVKNNKWGLVVSPDEKNIGRAIEEVILKGEFFKNNILQDFPFIRYKFSENVTCKYLSLYKRI